MSGMTNKKIEDIFKTLSKDNNIKIIDADVNNQINTELSQEMQAIKREYNKKEEKSYREAAKTLLNSLK